LHQNEIEGDFLGVLKREETAGRDSANRKQ